MALTNYTDLQASVAAYLHRTDLSTVIPDFIRLAESEFDRVLRTVGQLTSTTLTATDIDTALPSDFIAAKSVTLTFSATNYTLQNESEDVARSYTTSGTPVVYAISGTQLLLGPAPSSSCTVNLTYYKQIPPLATNSTNALLALYPDLYLWRSVYEGAKYTRDDSLVQMAGNEYQRVLGDVMLREQTRQYGPAPVMRRM